MKTLDIKKKSVSEIKKDLYSLYKERFKLRIEKSSGAEFKKGHLLKKNRKNIARVLTILREINNV